MPICAEDCRAQEEGRFRMGIVDRILFEPPGGQFCGWDNVNTFFAPKGTALYRSLLPQPLTMPARPTVLVYAAELDFFLLPKRYGEWSVLLLSSYRGREAWYPLTMPVTRWVALKAGRHVGFPKYIVDSSGTSSGTAGILDWGLYLRR
jgi:hypothetical protein